MNVHLASPVSLGKETHIPRNNTSSPQALHFSLPYCIGLFNLDPLKISLFVGFLSDTLIYCLGVGLCSDASLAVMNKLTERRQIHYCCIFLLFSFLKKVWENNYL